MRSEAEFQRVSSTIDNREQALENLDAEPGDSVFHGGEKWLFLEVVEKPDGPHVALEQWDEMATVPATKVDSERSA